MTVPTVIAVGLRSATSVHAVQSCCLLSLDETHLNAAEEEEEVPQVNWFITPTVGSLYQYLR